jgi:hypothetical protein
MEPAFQEKNIRRVVLSVSSNECPYTVFAYAKSTLDMEQAEIYEI